MVPIVWLLIYQMMCFPHILSSINLYIGDWIGRHRNKTPERGPVKKQIKTNKINYFFAKKYCNSMSDTYLTYSNQNLELNYCLRPFFLTKMLAQPNGHCIGRKVFCPPQQKVTWSKMSSRGQYARMKTITLDWSIKVHVHSITPTGHAPWWQCFWRKKLSLAFL